MSVITANCLYSKKKIPYCCVFTCIFSCIFNYFFSLAHLLRMLVALSHLFLYSCNFVLMLCKLDKKCYEIRIFLYNANTYNSHIISYAQLLWKISTLVFVRQIYPREYRYIDIICRDTEKHKHLFFIFQLLLHIILCKLYAILQCTEFFQVYLFLSFEAVK